MMKYYSTTLCTNWTKEEMNRPIIRILYFIFYFFRANPDNEKFYPQVKKWFLEIGEDGLAAREIGIDEDDNPLFSAPNDRNWGFFTDSDEGFEDDDLVSIDMNEFEDMWSRLN